MPLVRFVFKGADHFDDARVDVKAVDSAEAAGKQFLGRAGRETGRQAEDDDIWTPHMLEQFVEARKIRHAAQIIGRFADGSETSDNADALGIGRCLQSLNHIAADIAKAENGSLKRHCNPSL